MGILIDIKNRWKILKAFGSMANFFDYLELLIQEYRDQLQTATNIRHFLAEHRILDATINGDLMDIESALEGRLEAHKFALMYFRK